MTVLESVRAKCIDCCCGSMAEVRRCPCKDCSLYPYRMGHNPNRAGMGNAANFTKNAHSKGESESEG